MSAINQICPELRLKLLSKYMNEWVDKYPFGQTFHQWLRQHYRKYIPGTLEYYRSIATHCFYCDRKLIKNNNSEQSRSTIDHYHPKSKGQTEKFVICCDKCNTSKGNTLPSKLVSVITRAVLRGLPMWGYAGKKLQSIADQFQIIANDLIYNTGPKVYYIKK